MSTRNSLVRGINSFNRLRRAMHCWRTCPNCRQQIDLEFAVRHSGWSRLASPIFGIRCPKCKVILSVRQRRGFIIFWAVLASVFAIEMLGIKTGNLTHMDALVIAVGLGVFSWLMQRWKFQSLIELNRPPQGVTLREVTPSAKDYAFLEGKNGRDNAFRVDPAAHKNPGCDWICANCNQANPASFELCWKCNHRKPIRTE